MRPLNCPQPCSYLRRGANAIDGQRGVRQNLGYDFQPPEIIAGLSQFGFHWNRCDPIDWIFWTLRDEAAFSDDNA
jgi:hypothetical protein